MIFPSLTVIENKNCFIFNRTAIQELNLSEKQGCEFYIQFSNRKMFIKLVSTDPDYIISQNKKDARFWNKDLKQLIWKAFSPETASIRFMINLTPDEKGRYELKKY